MVAVPNMLNKNQVIAYVGQHAPEFGLDPAAVLAVANHEGLNTAPGSFWTLAGEGNISFGPPSWFGNGAGSAILQMFGGNHDQAAAFSWTPAGIDMWLKRVVSDSAQSGIPAVGKTGASAIEAIVRGFERPRANLVAGEITNASRDYASFQAAIGGGVQVPELPGQAPAQSRAQAPVQGQAQGQAQAPVQAASGASAPGMLSLGTVGPLAVGVPSGLLLGLIAIVLLIIGAVILAGSQRASNAAQMIAAPESEI